MCWKVDQRIQCDKHNYPYSEALFFDTGKYDCSGNLIERRGESRRWRTDHRGASGVRRTGYGRRYAETPRKS